MFRARPDGNADAHAVDDDLWHLAEYFGLPASFHNIEWTAKASHIRVLHHDNGRVSRATFQQDAVLLAQFQQDGT